MGSSMVKGKLRLGSDFEDGRLVIGELLVVKSRQGPSDVWLGLLVYGFLGMLMVVRSLVVELEVIQAIQYNI